MNAMTVRLACFLLAIDAIFAAGQNGPQSAAAPAEGETVHVLVGKSVVINVQSPLTRVLSSNPTAVEAMATSPTQVVVEGKVAGASSLILWDAPGHSQVLDVAVDLDIAGLRSAMQRAYPREQMDIEADGGRLLLTGTASNSHIVEDLGKMAGIYSKDVVNSIVVPLSHDRQVMLEVRFVEVDRAALNQLGFNFFSLGAGNNIGTTTTGQFGNFGGFKLSDIFGGGFPGLPYSVKDFPIDQALNLFLFRPDIHLGTVIQAMQAHNVAQILAEPNLMAISGQKATFLAGGEFPYLLAQPSGGIIAYSVQFKPFGVKLDFTAIVQEDNTLRMHVAPEVSNLDYNNSVAVPGGGTLPAIATRRAETEIELKDGQSFGIAGLLDQRAITTLSKIPGIGDIPVLGQLFRSKSINKTNNELLVFVTPHIVDPVRVATAAPTGPIPAVPFLDKKQFDQQIPESKQPANQPPSAGAK